MVWLILRSKETVFTFYANFVCINGEGRWCGRGEDARRSRTTIIVINMLVQVLSTSVSIEGDTRTLVLIGAQVQALDQTGHWIMQITACASFVWCHNIVSIVQFVCDQVAFVWEQEKHYNHRDHRLNNHSPEFSDDWELDAKTRQSKNSLSCQHKTIGWCDILIKPRGWPTTARTFKIDDEVRFFNWGKQRRFSDNEMKKEIFTLGKPI